MEKCGKDGWKQVAFLILLAAGILSFAACEKNGKTVAPSDVLSNARSDCDSCSILLVGNYDLFTQGSSIVDIFGEFAEAGGKRAHIDFALTATHRLHHHAADTTTLSQIREREWDYIILQGYPVYLAKEKWHSNLVPFLRELRSIIKENAPNTTVIYMMPWATQNGLTWIPGETETFDEMQDSLHHYATLLAKDLDIAIAPVGSAWSTAITDNFEADLFFGESFNQPGVFGAYLTASVFYATLYQEEAPPLLLPLIGDSSSYLRHLGHQTVMNDLPLWHIY